MAIGRIGEIGLTGRIGPMGVGGGGFVGFGFHVYTLQSYTYQVNLNCRKMWYRTKIGASVSGSEKGCWVLSDRCSEHQREVRKSEGGTRPPKLRTG